MLEKTKCVMEFGNFDMEQMYLFQVETEIQLFKKMACSNLHSALSFTDLEKKFTMILSFSRVFTAETQTSCSVYIPKNTLC